MEPSIVQDVDVTEHPVAAVEVGARGERTKEDALVVFSQERPVLLNDEMRQLVDRVVIQIPAMTKWAYGGKARAKVGLFVSRAKALAYLTSLAGLACASAISVATSLTAAEPSRTEYRAFIEDVSDLIEEVRPVIS